MITNSIHEYTFTFDEFIEKLGIKGEPKDIQIAVDLNKMQGYKEVRVKTEEYVSK